MNIIPAIDIIEGKCVRLSKGDYSTKKIYSEDPLDMAKRFEDHGIKYLHLVDLDGAKSKHIVNHKVLENIATNTSLQIDFGGGLKTDDDLRIAFESGAKQITGGSIAVKNPETFTSWINTYGADKIILGADARDEKIAVSGWLEESDKALIPFINEYQNKGITYVICTDISKDGTMDGPPFALYKKILKKFPNINLTTGGGIRSIKDLIKLKEIGVHNAIFGRAFYEGKIALDEIKDHLKK